VELYYITIQSNNGKGAIGKRSGGPIGARRIDKEKEKKKMMKK
jgi:hypothetical protein